MRGKMNLNMTQCLVLLGCEGPTFTMTTDYMLGTAEGVGLVVL